MSAYGDVAITAVELAKKQGMDPRTAWNTAAKRRFPRSLSMQTKGCPRSAFLGLCAAGLISGVNEQIAGSRLGKNAQYAVEAVAILRDKQRLGLTAQELWRAVISGKTHNSQMDVVLALRDGNLIREI
jgi:hypothetical protein